MLASGHLRISQMVIPKRGKVLYRVVTYYRGININTKKSSYPIPRIDALIDRLQIGRLFTKLYLEGAYQLLRSKEGMSTRPH